MYIEDSGSGPAVVLVHGLPSPPEELEPLARALATDHRVLLVHLPGYGRAPRPALPYDFEAVDRMLAAALAERGLDDVAFVGYSGGCYRGLVAATRGRLKLRAFVGLAPIAHLDAGEPEAFRGFAQAIAADVELGELMVERMLPPGWAAAHPEHAQAVAAWTRCVPADVLASELEAAADLPDVRPQLPELDVPVYLRVGELDQATPPRKALEMAGLLPDATLDVVPGVGHALLLQDANATVAAVRRFLAR